MLRISAAVSDGSANGGASLSAAIRYYEETAQKAQTYYEGDFAVDDEEDVLHTHGGECAERPTELFGNRKVLQSLGLEEGQHPTTSQVAALALGMMPDGSSRLVNAGARNAWDDLTFSAPKSFSVLFASLRVQGREREAQLLIDALHDAASSALKHYEREYFSARAWDRATRLQTPVKGEIVALLDAHSASRPVNGIADPSLHMHCRVMNVVRRADGSWSSLFSRELYPIARSLNAVFEAELRQRVERMGYPTVEQEHGDKHLWTSWEVAEVPQTAREVFSQRQAVVDALVAVEEKIRERPLTQREKEAISRRSRKAKNKSSLNEQTQQWAEVLEDTGYLAGKGGDEVATKRPDTTQLILNAPVSLLSEGSVWTHDDTLAYVSDFAVKYRLSAEDVEKLAAQVIENSVRFDHPLWGAVYTTQERIDQERGIVDYLISASTETHLTVPRKYADAAISLHELSIGHPLSEEQKAAVYALTSADGNALMLQGWAGAGKTETMRPMAAAMKAAGLQVLGTSTSSKATAQLAGDAHIEAWNLRDLITRLEHGTLRDGDGGPVEIGPRTVIVVDEAVMSNVQDLSELVKLCKRYHVAGIRLVGDTEQLSPIGSGSVVSWVSGKIGLAQVTKNFRQAVESEAMASQMLREGRGEEYLLAKDGHGLLDIEKDLHSAIEAAVEDWGHTLNSPQDARNNLLLCDLREAGVKPLNEAARRLFIERGWIDTKNQVDVDGMAWARGDRVELTKVHKEKVERCDEQGNVIYRRNGKPRFMTVNTPNRTRGVVTGIREDGLVIKTDTVGGLQSRTLNVLKSQIPHTLTRGYAGTVHVSQGLTVDNAFVVLPPSGLVGKQSGYVSASRTRVATKVYPVARENETRAETITRFGVLLSRDLSKTTTLDYASEEDREALTAKIREQQSVAGAQWSIHRSATPAQISLLQSQGVQDASASWTWIKASCEIDLTIGAGVPGLNAEAWLTTHGLSPTVARKRVQEELDKLGVNLASLYTASEAHLMTSKRRVAQLAEGREFSHQERNALQARVILQLQLQESRVGIVEGEKTRTREIVKDNGRYGLERTA